MRVPIFVFLVMLFIPTYAKAEFRTSKDMQNECRIALAVLQGTAENTSTNALLAGECVGFVQGVSDAAMALAENAKWYKVCAPDSVSAQDLIQRFIAFVDANPKYTLASTAIQIMLAQSFPCRK